MIRPLALILLATVFASAVGAVACRLLGVNPGVREMLLAGGACVVAAGLALLPLLLVRGAEPAAVVQAGLVATIVHLFVILTVAAFVLLAHVPVRPAFLYWLMADYWVTLAGVAAAAVGAARGAAAQQGRKSRP